MKKPGLHLVIVFWGLSLSLSHTHTVVVCVVRETRERKIVALYRPVMKRENMLFFAAFFLDEKSVEEQKIIQNLQINKMALH